MRPGGPPTTQRTGAEYSSLRTGNDFYVRRHRHGVSPGNIRALQWYTAVLTRDVASAFSSSRRARQRAKNSVKIDGTRSKLSTHGGARPAARPIHVLSGYISASGQWRAFRVWGYRRRQLCSMRLRACFAVGPPLELFGFSLSEAQSRGERWPSWTATRGYFDSGLSCVTPKVPGGVPPRNVRVSRN